MRNERLNIIPHLWFDTQAVEAAEFYASVFPDSAVNFVTTLRDTPSGDCDVVSFKLWGMTFQAISAGPQFTLNPSISFIVNFDPLFFGFCESAAVAARECLDATWEQLIEGGTVMMPLDAYPFSERFGWVQDRYGVSWQLILSNPEGDPRPPIVPAMMFINDNNGRAGEAIDFYLSVFDDGKLGGIRPYPPGAAPDENARVMFADFRIRDTWIAAMDSGGAMHDFNFNEALSFMAPCEDQAEIDRVWTALNADPEGGQCGWLKDKFGVSWQIVPAAMDAMMRDASEAQMARMMRAMLPMKKLDLAAIRAAFES